MKIRDFVKGLNLKKATGFGDGARDRYRELIRIRDNQTCQICGKEWVFGSRKFDVHHKDLIKEKTRQVDGDEDMDNLITLCHKCHLNLPEHREKMKKKLST